MLTHAVSWVTLVCWQAGAGEAPGCTHLCWGHSSVALAAEEQIWCSADTVLQRQSVLWFFFLSKAWLSPPWIWAHGGTTDLMFYIPLKLWVGIVQLQQAWGFGFRMMLLTAASLKRRAEEPGCWLPFAGVRFWLCPAPQLCQERSRPSAHAPGHPVTGGAKGRGDPSPLHNQHSLALLHLTSGRSGLLLLSLVTWGGV